MKYINLFLVGGRWTIHGVWPSLKSGPHGPFNCDNKYPFNPSSLDPIMDKLNAQWTDVHKNARKDDFWRHEWTKHGTCAMQLESMSNELKYFSKGTIQNFVILTKTVVSNLEYSYPREIREKNQEARQSFFSHWYLI